MKVSTGSFSLKYLYCAGPAIDFIAIVFSGYLSWTFVFGFYQMHDRYWLASSIIGVVFLFLNKNKELYGKSSKTNIYDNLLSFLYVWLLVAIFSMSIIYLSHASDKFSRIWFFVTLIIGAASCGGVRFIYYSMSKIFPSNLFKKRIYLISGSNNEKIKRKINKNKKGGYEIVGEVYVKGEVADGINEKINESFAQEIWLIFPLEMGGELKKILYAIRHQTAEIRFFPDVSDLPLINQKTSNILGDISIDISVSPIKGEAKFWKRLEDITLSLLAIILFSPFMLVISVLIKMESRGPVIFKQYRAGMNGNVFKVYKFRSMIVHEEKKGGLKQASKNDARITKIGAFLRKTSLDELPQLYNVLQGSMSIVGPRPHALAHNEYYKDIVESYMQRHKVKPGITGWAQVCGFRGETDTIDKMQKRVQMDIWYICNWSIMLDFKIIVLTPFKGFVHKNAY